MSSMFTNLLFMHGHITDLELVRRLAEAPAPTAKPGGKRKRVSTAASRSAGSRSGNVVVTALRWATAR